MTVLIDMDDTIENLSYAWNKFIREMYDVDVYPEDITEWDLTKIYTSLTKEQIYAPLHMEEMWNSVVPIDNAVEYIQKIISDGDDVYIVTTTHYSMVEMKMRCVMGRYFPFIPYDKVIITSNKQLVMGDVLVDDGPHNLTGGMYEGILFDATHNRSFNERLHGIQRAHGWKEVYDIIQKMKGVFANDRN